MKRILKQFRYGEKGFTLIELLVVIAILGVLAAIVVPNVGKFMGSGTVEAANTEAHNVQTAVMAYMVDNNLATLPDTGTPEVPTGVTGTVGPNTGEDIPTTGPTETATSVKSFITGRLQAIYTISTEGNITDATTLGVTDSKWTGLVYGGPGHEGEGWHK